MSPPPMQHVLLALTAVTLGAACGDGVSPGDAATPADITVATGALAGHVGVLAHDSMCGRPAGTRYERQAAAYVAGVFDRAGLGPGAEDGSFYQDVVLGPAGRERRPVTQTCRADTLYQSRNVLGVVPGAGALALEWVVVGAHYDHLGWDSAGTSAAVYNGADDNGSGVAIVLEMARLYQAWVDAHPDAESRRSVMFHAYGAEEIGLLGSAAFVGLTAVPLETIRTMVNFDMVGRLRDGRLVIGTADGAAWSGLLDDIRPATINYVFSQEFLDRSDQAPFLAQGIPAIHVFTGLHPEYHTPADDVGLLNVNGMREVAEFGLDLLWELVRRPDGL